MKGKQPASLNWFAKIFTKMRHNLNLPSRINKLGESDERAAGHPIRRFSITENNALRGLKPLAAKIQSTGLLTFSFLLTAIFFAIFLVLLRPGYGANDDIDIIAIASGYLGGKPVPFLIFSNVILGFALNFLYGLHPQVNWEMLVFLAINFCSLWALLFAIMTSPLPGNLNTWGLWVMLLADGYFLLNLTFTTIAAFACIAGFFLILDASKARTPWRIRLAIAGLALLLAGSLVRIETVWMVLALIAPAVALCWRGFHLPRLAVTLGVAVLLVGSGYLVDRVVMQVTPAWHTFDVYNNTRSLLQDTPRVTNLAAQAHQVGWSKNDLHVFIHWFFPDPKIYSLEHLRYLADHVPATPNNLISAIGQFVKRSILWAALPYWMIIVIGFMIHFNYLPHKVVGLPFLALGVSFAAIGLYLSMKMKLPDRVLLPMLATLAVFQVGLLIWAELSLPHPNETWQFTPTDRRLMTLGTYLLIVGAIILVISQSVATTRANIQRQAAYHQILSDFNALQAHGKLAKGALILSPAHGVPLEWANPLRMELPEIQYMEMGWLTFSPPYEKVLRQYGVDSLPAGFYQKDNVYLMDNVSSMMDIVQYIREHEGVAVIPKEIYDMPNRVKEQDYSHIRLYQLQAR